MEIKYIFKRFSECRNRFIKKKVNVFQNTYFFIDWLLSFLIHGASINDYFSYSFYNLNHSGRKRFITYKKHKKIQSICNFDYQAREICRNKQLFNKYFSKYLGREWINLSEIDFDGFKQFVSTKKAIFVKDINGYCAIGINKILVKENDLNELYKEFSNNIQSEFIAESLIKQNESLSVFHPWSINTIRIVSVYNDAENKVHLMNARFRIGNKKNAVDNFHFDGITSNIDIKTGVIESKGYDKNDNTYVFHPISGKKIVGFEIPEWERCKEYVERIAREIPKVRYVGWDIVIGNQSDFYLIEANDNADHDIQQMHNRGLWKDYKSIINKLKPLNN